MSGSGVIRRCLVERRSARSEGATEIIWGRRAGARESGSVAEREIRGVGSRGARECQGLAKEYGQRRGGTPGSACCRPSFNGCPVLYATWVVIRLHRIAVARQTCRRHIPQHHTSTGLHLRLAIAIYLHTDAFYFPSRVDLRVRRRCPILHPLHLRFHQSIHHCAAPVCLPIYQPPGELTCCCLHCASIVLLYISRPTLLLSHHISSYSMSPLTTLYVYLSGHLLSSDPPPFAREGASWIGEGAVAGAQRRRSRGCC